MTIEAEILERKAVILAKEREKRRSEAEILAM